MLNAELKTRLRDGSIAYVIAILIMVIIPLHYSYLPPFMIMLGLCWILEHYQAFGELIRFRSRYMYLFIGFTLFYFWQVTSLFYTNDLRLGWSNAFGRLSIFVFPLILYNPVDKIRINVFKLLRIFALSTAVYTITCFGYALYRSLSFQGGLWIFNPHPPEFEWLNYFYGPELAYSIHPSYLAMFVLISVFISFESWYEHSIKTKFRFGWIILGILLLGSVYFISSRASILAGLIMIPFYALNKIIKYRKSRFIWIIVVIVFIISLPLIRNNDRVNYFLRGFLNKDKINLRDQDERIIVWESALKIVKNNLIVGVGIGDVQSELVNELVSSGEDKLARQRLNAHNQFLEVLLEGGVIGFSIFLSVLGFMTFIAIKEKNLLYGLFILMMFVFFMFESILNRLAGVSFFSLFSIILLQIQQNKVIPYNPQKSRDSNRL